MNCAFSRLRLVVCSGLSVVSLLLGPQCASALVIDDFTQGPLASIQGTNTAQFGTTVVQTGLDPSYTLGGTRSVFAFRSGQAKITISLSPTASAARSGSTSTSASRLPRLMTISSMRNLLKAHR